MNNSANRLFQKVSLAKIDINYVCEVGVFKPDESNILGFISKGISTLLVEADPIYVNNLRDYFKDCSNVQIVEAAVYDYSGSVSLYRREASTFIGEVTSSPALINDNYILSDEDRFEARSILFSEIDNGKLDLISIDIEGAEWFVLKYMRSKPKVISIETHGKYYVNPNIDKISEWMEKNGYKIWYLEKSDTIFIQNGIIKISIWNKLGIKYEKLKFIVKKQKRLLKIIIGEKV